MNAICLNPACRGLAFLQQGPVARRLIPRQRWITHCISMPCCWLNASVATCLFFRHSRGAIPSKCKERAISMQTQFTIVAIRDASKANPHPRCTCSQSNVTPLTKVGERDNYHVTSCTLQALLRIRGNYDIPLNCSCSSGSFNSCLLPVSSPFGNYSYLFDPTSANILQLLFITWSSRVLY